MKRLALGLGAAAATAALAATPALACHGGGKTAAAVHARDVAAVKFVAKHGGGPAARAGRRRPPAILRADRYAAGRSHFLFIGNLTATPGSSPSTLTITVSGGDRQSLARMLGQSTTQNFAVSSSTKVVKVGNGSGSFADLAQGDLVWIEVSAPRDSTLQQIEQQAAVRVLDRGQVQAGQHLTSYVFRGTLSAAAGTSSLSLNVSGGDVRALKLLISQSAAQTFTFDSSTKFVRVVDRKRSQASASDLQAGDRVRVTIRAAAGATLAQVEQAAARQVIAVAAGAAPAQA